MTAIISTRLVGVAPTRRSASEWHALMGLYSSSAETRQQFCARHGVALSTFAWWRRRLRQQGPTPLAARSSTPTQALFVELEPPSRALSPAWDMELELGDGVFLRLRRAAC